MKKYYLSLIVCLVVVMFGCSSGSSNFSKPLWTLVTNMACEYATYQSIKSGECIPVELKEDIIPTLQKAEDTLINSNGSAVTVGKLLSFLTYVSDQYAMDDDNDNDSILVLILRNDIKYVIKIVRDLGPDEEVLSGEDYRTARYTLGRLLSGLKASASVADYYNAWC